MRKNERTFNQEDKIERNIKIVDEKEQKEKKKKQTQRDRERQTRSLFEERAARTLE